MSGDNIGATLQTSQAEADKLIAQAKAEVRRAAAVASNRKWLRGGQEMRAKVVEAEAQIPLAMAEAFRAGKSRRHGLLPDAQHPGGLQHARKHRRHRLGRSVQTADQLSARHQARGNPAHHPGPGLTVGRLWLA